MTIRSTLGKLADRIADRVDWLIAPRVRIRRESELISQWLMSSEDAREIRYPAFYVQFMRQWHEKSPCEVQWVKRPSGTEMPKNGSRFATLLEELEKRNPIPPLSVARAAAKRADKFLDNRDAVQIGHWAADVGLAFAAGSTLARNGRLLCSTIRFLRPSRVLELGTAYGMSALFMGLKLERLSGAWSITTVEFDEHKHALASAMLCERFNEGSMNCILGSKHDVLESLKSAGAQFDLLFHDAGHTRDDYITDFGAAESLLPSGAVFLIDDIRWEDERFHSGPARTYEGWQYIVAHPRVAMAAELNQSMGIALLK